MQWQMFYYVIFRDLLVHLAHKEIEGHVGCLVLEDNQVLKVNLAYKELKEMKVLKGHREIKERAVQRYPCAAVTF